MYAIYFFPNLFLIGLAYILSPLFATWSMKYGPVLPMPWKLFSTLNGTLDGGIDQRVKGFDADAKGFKLWYQRCKWTWRNPCNGFQSEIFGLKDYKDGFTIKRDIPLFGKYNLKLWIGWDNRRKGGNYYPYMFQCKPQKKD
ncbi:hypothetical protein EVB99_098 [Rhizobium phage RHph_N3_19]|nr:hypothetical protein EVB99_098 [Rhizobium phage RHph_N3_19]